MLFSSLIATTFIPGVKAETFDENGSFITDVVEGRFVERNFNLISFPMTTNEREALIEIKNLGDNTVDKVEISVKCLESGLGNKKTILNAKVGTTKVTLPLNMLKASEKVEIVIKVTEGGKTKTINKTLSRKISDSALKVWHRGTYASVALSLEDHFKRHGREVSTTNIVSYFNKAVAYQKEVLNNVNKGNTDIYKISVGIGSIPSKKYKHKTDGRYILLSNSDSKIFSFGK